MILLKVATIVLSIFSLLSVKANTHDDTLYFKNFPANANPVEVGKKISERFLERPHSNTGSWYTEEQKKIQGIFNHPVGYIVYPDVCAWYGALTYAKVAHAAPISENLIKRAGRIFTDESQLVPKANHVDNNVFGVIPLEVYAQTGDKRFLDLGLYMANEQFKKVSSSEFEKLDSMEKIWYNRGLSWNTRMWIDDMYMITILQAQAYKATGDEKYINQAAKQMVAYLDELQKENGLFHHADNVPIYWGRGNGWMAAGMAELLAYLPERNQYSNRIMTGFRQMMNTLLKYQDSSGMWHQILDDQKAWAETSCTGMFTFAYITGVKKGWLDATTFGPAARKGWTALCSYINNQGDVSDICVGTNKKNNYQYYINRPKAVGDLHGQAPLLWCATALLK